ncbi:MAG TPA: MFS transporter, partial [Trebonia sp.]
MTTVGAPARASYRSVLAVREFRVLFAAMIMFAFGFEFEILGLSVLVYARTGSSVWAAAAFSAGFLPQAAGGAFLTSLSDRLSPRAVIAAGLLARALPGLVIGLAPGLPAAAMLALVAAVALVTPVFLAGSSALLPEILDGDAYIMGRSLFSIANSGVQIAGLGVGGAILAELPARWLLAAAGGSLAIAAAVTRLGLRPRPPRAKGGARGTIRATISGNADLLASARVRRLLLAQWLPCWFATGAESLIVPFAVSAGHPAGAASALLACVPGGMLAGDVVVGRFCPPPVRERLVLPLALLLGAPLIAFAFRPPLEAAGV